MKKGKDSIYAKYIKRILDIICALSAMIVFCWLYAIVAILVRVKLGSPVVFKQVRPGIIDENGQEKLFTICKFRTMVDERDADGNLLPDEMRLTKFGCLLRKFSLDEITEAWNILKGDMSVVGPRPLLVRDMVFMTEQQRKRHSVKPGLTGLAQVSGRNAIDWNVKLDKDLEYIDEISFLCDLKIVFKTVKQVIFRKKALEDEEVDEIELTEDFGDYLLNNGTVIKDEYDMKLAEAQDLLCTADV